GNATGDVVGQTVNFYDGPAFVGLPFGQLGDHGLLSRTEVLVLTESVLQQAYSSDDPPAAAPDIPPYLAANGEPRWSEDYPEDFRERLAPLAGYVFQPGGPDSPYARGYFAPTQKARYDFQEDASRGARGLLTAKRDPFGHDATVAYDAFALFPVEATASANLTAKIAYDLRVLQPCESVDHNGNRTRVIFTPLGLVSSTAVTGKTSENVGDTPERPGSRIVYDLLAFAERRQPVSVRTIRRVHHAASSDIPLPERDDTIETVEYSDGFGRLLQTRVQADDVAFG